MKQLLKIKDLSKKEIQEILNLADQLKYEKKNGIEHPLLKSKSTGLLFAEPSSHCLLSFATAIGDLGGSLVQLNAEDMKLCNGPLEDTARFLCRYLDCLVLRDFTQQDEEAIASLSTIPVINALSQSCHPLQTLAALMTIREKKGVFQGRKLTIIGGAGPAASSLIWGGLKMGMEVCLCCPETLKPDEESIIQKENGRSYAYSSNPKEAVKAADVMYVCPYTDDSTYSEEFESYQINKELISLAKEDVLIMHPLPAHRGWEIESETFDSYADEIFDEAENRLHVQKSVLVLCMKGN